MLYVVFYMPINLMLYTGYLKNIPIALEEAARVDGASTWKTYWSIIFPVMKPMHATVAVLTAMAVWNDVMTPLVIMSGTGAFFLICFIRFTGKRKSCCAERNEKDKMQKEND